MAEHVRIRLWARYLLAILLSALLVSSMVGGCSKEKSQPTLPGAHPAAWMDTASEDFHGDVVWATGAQSCAECHGSDWRGGKVGISCIDCHLASGIACTRCHGGLDNSTGAPPYGLASPLDDTSAAIGAHTAHMEGKTFSDGVPCASCHRVPAFVLDSLHLEPNGGTDSIAEVTWHSFADSLGGATWDRTARTCSNTYCHGQFAGGDSTNTPGWNEATVDCGSCHSSGADPASLGWKHEYHILWANLFCADCHAGVVDTLDEIVGFDLHVNGMADTLTRDSTVCQDCHGSGPIVCVRCHGGLDNQTGAPPEGLSDETSTTDRVVGAHSAHVEDGLLADAFDCNECHIKPANLLAPGHLDADSTAEIIWNGLSSTSGAVWDTLTATCANVYCHGNFTGGTASNSPVWTGTDQALCGSCHDTGSDPTALQWKHEYHVGAIGLRCGDCHANVVDTQLNVTNIALHINGVADTLTRDPAICNVCHGPAPASCKTCHGGTDNLTGAPPVGLRGETLVTDVVVGAHSAHVQDGAVANSFDCVECHVKPTALLDPGHLGADSIAEITWGGIAPAPGAAWNSGTATCSGTYCHGNFPGGMAANEPLWTGADQALCGSCHRVALFPENLLWKHEYHVGSIGLECEDCHASVVDLALNITDLTLHVNGVADTLTRDTAVCNACHGPAPASCVTCHGGIDNATGAPPSGLLGQTAATTRQVGAHSTHVMGGSLADAFDCVECHVKPSALMDAGHLGADSVAEVVWGGIAPATNATWHPGTTTCSDTYCHGNFLGGEGANVPDWTASNQAACGSCHDDGTNPQRLSGRHSKHVSGENIQCYQCHNGTVDSGKNLIGLDLHVNGNKDVVFSSGNGTWDGTSCASVGCHGTEDWY